MVRSKLTNGAVERFECRDGKAQDVLWDSEVRGFGLRLSRATGARTYILVYRVKGTNRERSISIGRHDDPWRVDQARARAIKLKSEMRDGIDPVEQERERQAQMRQQAARDEALSTTLREVMEDYLANRRTKHGPLRARTQQDIRTNCDSAFASWMDEPVASITRDRCLAKFTTLSERAPAAANLSFVYLRALLNHAREMHADEDGEYRLLSQNPVTRMFKLRKPNANKARDTRIPLDRVGACWNWLRARAVEGRSETERTAADWLSFVMLTGCRRTESASLMWEDVDLDGKTFALRGEVVKNHKALTLPMSTVMHELLTARHQQSTPEKITRRRSRTRASEYVFASNGLKNLHVVDARLALEELTKIAGTTVHMHALRRTFDDLAMECRIDSDVRRVLLNHIGGDVHSRHYANGTAALGTAVQQIADWIVGQAAQAAAVASGANVVALPRKQNA
jgi:integrase